MLPLCTTKSSHCLAQTRHGYNAKNTECPPLHWALARMEYTTELLFQRWSLRGHFWCSWRIVDRLATALVYKEGTSILGQVSHGIPSRNKSTHGVTSLCSGVTTPICRPFMSSSQFGYASYLVSHTRSQQNTAISSRFILSHLISSESA